MEDKIKSFEEVCEICHKLQNEGKKIIAVHGSFEVLHVGHIALLSEAKKAGNILVVAVNQDFDIKYYKGEVRPLVPLDLRMFSLSHITSVDFVFPFPSIKKLENYDIEKVRVAEFERAYSLLHPDIIASSPLSDRNSYKQRVAEKINAKFLPVNDYINYISTSKLITLLN